MNLLLSHLVAVTTQKMSNSRSMLFSLDYQPWPPGLAKARRKPSNYQIAALRFLLYLDRYSSDQHNSSNLFYQVNYCGLLTVFVLAVILLQSPEDHFLPLSIIQSTHSERSNSAVTSAIVVNFE